MRGLGPLLPGEGFPIPEALSVWLAELDATIEIAIKTLDASESSGLKVTRTRSRNTVTVVVGLYVKALKTASTIRRVAWTSRAEDGFVLCRTLLETVVAIFYVLQKHTAVRSDEYMAHLLMRTQKIMEKWQQTHGLRGQGKRIGARADKELRAFKQMDPARLKELRVWYSGDKTLEATFKRVTRRAMYETLYLRLTGYQHVSDLDCHVSVDEKGVLDLRTGPSDPSDVTYLLKVTNFLLWSVVQRVSEKMDLGCKAEILNVKPS